MIVDRLISLQFGVYVWTYGDEANYDQRAAQSDMSLIRKLDHAGNGLLTGEYTRGDLHLGPHFDAIDANRHRIVTLQVMRI